MSPKKLVGAIFTGMGGLFLVIGLAFLIQEAQFERTATRTTGEVVGLRSNGKGSRAPDVAFTDFDGRPRLYQSNIYSSPSYQLGDRVPIAYDLADPDRAAIDTLTGRWLLPTIFSGLGLIEFTAGFTLLTLRRRRKQEIERLLREGQRVDAAVLSVQLDRSVRVNGKHPWVIRCEATLPGESSPRTFTSRRFWSDPTALAQGRSLPVYYNPQDPSRHVVDTRELGGQVLYRPRPS